MQIAGIAFVTRPERFWGCLAAAGQVDGVEVHAVDPATGRAALTIEAPDVEGQMDRLTALQRLPGVVLAELAYHAFGDDDADHAPEEEVR